MMDIAYIDESGNSGYNASHTYTLGCVLVADTQWPNAFDGMIRFRRMLKEKFGILIRDEIKANYLVRNSHTFEKLNLGDNARQDIYKLFMRLPVKLQMEVFAIVIRKADIKNQDRDPRDIAWEFLFQRLERRSTTTGNPILIIHDEGETANIRKLARRARRINQPGSAFGLGHLDLPFKMLIDDPVPRNSSHNYMIQLADLCAYAAFRTVIPPSEKPGRVCPEWMWNELAGARWQSVNYISGGTPGIVTWPKKETPQPESGGELRPSGPQGTVQS